MSNVNKYTIDQIEEIAAKIRSKVGVNENEILDITELADQLDVDVYEVEFDNNELFSVLFKKNEKQTIYLDKSLNEGDKRYSIALQIAHIILNHNEKYAEDEYMTEYKETFKGCSTPTEYGEQQQAILLAIALLMPAKQTNTIWQSKLNNINFVAEYFRVSAKVATLRLDNLGLI